MKRWFLCTAVLVCMSLPAVLAQTETPATHDDIVKLFDTMKIHDQMQTVIDATIKQQRSVMREALRKNLPEMTDEEFARFDKLSDQMIGDISKEMPIEGLLDDMVPIYQKHLSKSDVDAMNAFYASPTGQKLMREMPAMTSESMQVTAPRMQAAMEKVLARIQQVTKEEIEKQQAPANKQGKK
jgi:uncharacterized protein